MADLAATDPAPSSCCSTETTAICCKPDAKEACCCTAAAGGSCGCPAGRDTVEPASGIRETVREKYAAAARAAAAEPAGSCCGVATADATGARVLGGALYTGEHAAAAPESALDASLGCGVPTAVADLHEGETVLDRS